MSLRDFLITAFLLWFFIRFSMFLLESWEYKAKMKARRNGYPKAHYPKINKPSFFKSKNH